MTKQELIDHLEHLADYVKYSEDAPALREAIEMLRCSEIPNSSDERTDKRTGTHACDCISRQDAITEFSCCELTPDGGIDANYAIDFLKHLPSVQPDSKKLSFTHKALDTISRQAAIDLFPNDALEWDTKGGYIAPHLARQMIEELPSAQPERTCVNCGRTANNGGWYADGGTRCPIEEHYALPKNGYCHLWEKRNVTDDDYPERRTDE